jgi:hypothetical protein
MALAPECDDVRFRDVVVAEAGTEPMSSWNFIYVSGSGSAAVTAVPLAAPVLV